MWLKYLILLTLQIIILHAGEEKFDAMKWLDGALNETISNKIPQENIVKQLCDFSVEKAKNEAAAEGEQFINYHIMFPGTEDEPHKAVKFPKLSPVARIGPAEAAKRIRHFGYEFPTRLSDANGTAPELYDAESGMMAREARWERNMYCMEWLGHMLQKHAERTLATKVIGSKTIGYRPLKIAVRTNIATLTEQVNEDRTSIRNYLGTVGHSSNGLMSKEESVKIDELRTKLSNDIDEVAKEEGKDGAEKASSMSLIAEYVFNRPKEHGGMSMQNNKPVLVLISSTEKKWEIFTDGVPPSPPSPVVNGNETLTANNSTA